MWYFAEMESIVSAPFDVEIQAAVTGWDKFLCLLRIFGLLGWDATNLLAQNSPDLSGILGSLHPYNFRPQCSHKLELSHYL